MDKEKLEKIRKWLIENIFRNADIMLSDNRYIWSYENPGEGEEIDMCEIIASLYEVLHKEVTGEPYNYFFHWANKVGSWVEDNMFTDQIGGDQNGD